MKQSNNHFDHFSVIPWSFATANCDVKTPIRHLSDDSTSCVQTMDEHDQFINEFQTKLKSVKILKHRKSFDTPASIMNDFCESAQNSNETENCVYVEIFHCLDSISLRTCKNDGNSTVENLITNEVSIQFHHNFTNILNFTVFFVYHELDEEMSSMHVTQSISIKYLESNETYDTRDAHQVSGNVGYLQHRPVIITQFIQINQTQSDESTQVERVLSYFYDGINCTNDDHYLKLPKLELNGDCVLDNATFDLIKFGESTRIKCNALLTDNALNDTKRDPMPEFNMFGLHLRSQNYTKTCRAYQKTILNYLLYRFELENPNATIYNEFNMHLSELGNPRNDTSHWISFRTVNPPNFDEIVATDMVDSTEGELTFVCTNMVLNVRYEFFYGVMMVGNIANQASIKVAQIQFGNRVNLKMKLDDEELKVPLAIDVMFYDFSRIVRNDAALPAFNLLPVVVLFIIMPFII